LPLQSRENYAEGNNYKLYLVMTGFAFLNKTTQQKIESPLFALDYDYYKTKYRSTACKKFENYMLGRPLDYKDNNDEGDIFFLKKNKLVKVLRDLPN
jgi:hypothetical protein